MERLTKPQLINKCRQTARARAFAWAKYYEECEMNLDADRKKYHTIVKVRDETELPPHLIDEFMEMTSALRKKIECPICLEIIDELKITSCGHKYCAG
ncbi:unnamed protein product, partial [marine sediment metagenome]